MQDFSYVRIKGKDSAEDVVAGGERGIRKAAKKKMDTFQLSQKIAAGGCVFGRQVRVSRGGATIGTKMLELTAGWKPWEASKGGGINQRE